tara:strand:+ start:173 stop:517 length:345 start_codon:yes stop_codon:yes gene_type:complete
MVILYGIKNCDSVKKARAWLTEHNVQFKFHDFRSDGLTESIIDNWLKKTEWELLLNRRGITWRNLDASVKDTISHENIIHVLLEYPTLIKRPVLNYEEIVTIGFNSDIYKAIFN